MKLKASIIRVMSRDDLKAVIDEHGITSVDRRNRDSMAKSVGRRKEIQAEDLLPHLAETQVKEICEKMGLSSVGRKNALAEALLDQFGSDEGGEKAQKTGLPRKARQTSLLGDGPLFEKKPALKPGPASTPPKPARKPVIGRKLKSFDILAPGTRILVRDAEWLVRRVDKTTFGGQAVRVVGISELVRDKEAVFLTELEPSIEVLDPADTRIVPDPSPAYRASLLYMESLLRQTPPTDENLYIGQHAAMDLVPFQLDPAVHALQQPRQRILLADAVGLGKTMECGILLSELIRRGRGKRILVLAIKSMLTQFQKELWSRFTIPLTRLDSVGIQRIRHNIPTNHNPFYYYDKAIISIDTLKQDAEYRTYLENAYWDVIVIDEAQNVAERGKKRSLRSKLADLLASRSDTLIMLSATPHDGRARSFASLMNMLDPTAIADPEKYTKDDIKGLFIRRFKKDIKEQVQESFKDRRIHLEHCPASTEEEQAYDAFVDTRFAKLDQRKGAGQLFKTTLEKALFSSPAACLKTIGNRIKTIEKKEDPEWKVDIQALETLREEVMRIGVKEFAKYQRMLGVIRDAPQGLGWTGDDPTDRLVIFTERIKTMEFLREHLVRDLKLSDGQVATLHGQMPDMEQQKVVEAFGKDEAPVRLLIASDVASEGINLHYLCHKMVHFDIPWSLMVFKQRNGRIDRYGQDHEPQIFYLVTDSRNAKIKGDARILELLIEKDQQAVENIGDPANIMGVHDTESEEQITARAMEEGLSKEQFGQKLEEMQAEAFDPLAAFMGEPQPTGEEAQKMTRPVHSLFPNDYAYFQEAIKQIQQEEWLQVEFYPEDQRLELTAPEDLQHRFRFLPREIWPEQGGFALSADNRTIQDEIKRCRKDELAWPTVHYLWPLNPVVEWANDKVLAAFGRHEAPLISLPNGALEDGEVVFVVSGLIPNRKSHPLVHTWFGVRMKDGKLAGIEPFENLQERLGLGRTKLANLGDSDKDAADLQSLLSEVVKQAKEHMGKERTAFEDQINPKLDAKLKSLEELRTRHEAQVEFRFANQHERRGRERRRVAELFDEFIGWVEDTMTTEDNPYIQVVAVLRGSN